MSDSKNICFFNSTPFWGGGEKWHFEAAVQTAEAGHSTYFVCTKESQLSKKLAKHPVQQFHIGVTNRSFLNPSKIKKLARFFKEKQIDVVIFNSPKDLKIGGKAAKKAGIKTIVYRRGIAVEVKPKAFTKKLFNEVVTHFIFNSEATKNLLTKHYPEVLNKKKTAVIYNAINFPQNTEKQHNSPIVIGNAGRLVEQKNQVVIPQIAQLLKEKGLSFQITIAGDGQLKKDIQAAIQKAGVEQEVKLLGFVDNMSEFMSSIDIFISTAKWEGFGFVLAEAMAHGVPVLAFDLSSNPELVHDQSNGFLIAPDNLQQFANKLQELIEDESRRKEMGDVGHAFALANFESKKQFKKLMEFVLT